MRNISLALAAGEILAIVGKSGSGKTTLLKCIYGLEDLISGEILLDMEPVTGPAYNLIPGHEQMKLVSQDYYVLDNHTVEENVYDKLQGYSEENKLKRTTTVLKLLELTRLRNTLAANLSSGQKQRVAIARALAVLPKVLLLDEPFSNLDKLLRDKLFTFISREVKRHRTSVILVTHTSEEALKYADTVTILDDGKIVQYGPVWKVYYHPRSLKLAGLLGPYNTIKGEEFETGSALTGRKKIFTRPDKLKISPEKGADLRLKVLKTAFNGKCYEILGETPGGATVLVYSPTTQEENKTGYYTIEP